MFTPTHPHGSRLCQIFSYPWFFLEGTNHDCKRPNWRTEKKYPVKPRVLWRRHQDAAQLVGVRFGSLTSYAMIDIDSGSAARHRLDDLRLALETIGICRWLPIRSSFSGGLHIYIPLPEAVKTFDLAVALRDCLVAAGFTVTPGQLELFPNVKSYGRWWMGEFFEYNGHRLPLQPGSGSCLLDNDCSDPIGSDLSQFFARWDNCSLLQDADQLAIALSAAREHHRKRHSKKAVSSASQWREDLEFQIEEGWSGPGQTNSVLKTIACYGRVFERLDGQTLAGYIERIATSRPGYQEHCQHHHEIRKRAGAWARAAEKYYWPLGDEPLRQTERYQPNDTKAEDAKERIRLAVAELRLNPPEGVRAWASALCSLARTSMKTLYKYLDLWHPKKRCVTPLADYVSGDGGAQPGILKENPESLDLWGVTHDAPFNEVCNLKDALTKISSGMGMEGGRGGRKGLSTGLDGAL